MQLLPLLPRLMGASLLCMGLYAYADVLTEVQNQVAQGNPAGALKVAEDAMQVEPHNAQARFLRAVALMDLQRNAEALEAFTRLSQEYPELPEPFNNIALLQVRAGQLELARQALETALRNDPSHRTARANLGEVYLMLAVKSWELAAAAGPLDGRLVRRLEAARALVAAGALPTPAPAR